MPLQVVEHFFENVGLAAEGRKGLEMGFKRRVPRTSTTAEKEKLRTFCQQEESAHRCRDSSRSFDE